jgi:N-acetylglutamate synthase-like GNAT family acetyltransferase
MTYELARPATPTEWQAFHDIRRTELFERKGRHGVYDPNHPHDLDPRNEPLLLRVDGRAVGTVRLDNFGDGTGCVRLVAITAAEQGRGHGRKMEEMVEALARGRGIQTLYVNAAPTAVGFYERTGWSRFTWNAEELTGVAAGCVQMRKQIA